MARLVAMRHRARMFVKWLAQGLEKSGKSQKGLAYRLGVSEPVISRMVSGAREIRLAEIPAIADYIEEDPPPLTAGQSPLGGQSVPIIGAIAARVWREKFGEPKDIETPLIIPPDARYPFEDQYSLTISDKSVDYKAQPGDYCICVPFEKHRLIARPCDYLHIKRIKVDGDVLANDTVRRVKRVDGGLILIFASSLTDLEDEISLDDPSISIRGLVIGFGSYRGVGGA